MIRTVRDAKDGISDTEEKESEVDDDGETGNKEDDDDLSVASISNAISFVSAKSGVVEEAHHASPTSSIVVIKNSLRLSDESSYSSGDESDSE